ncbi:MAG: flagellar motor stator protein MotA [SAR324 cluster bacterium]|uniref:Flagellar motor stator protein MotA n=1 Tax=SAR324 cluster bacterium TaxID=2024889 RepID=A0A7X9IJ86_9DELT|nr:flagellar motor stator protein MotA [SAR324 cluster bacterium]
MFLILGLIGVISSIIYGYTLEGGAIILLWQPAEVVIIGGAAVFSMIAANPPSVNKGLFPAFVKTVKGSGINKGTYRDLLGLMASTFDTMRREGVLGIEGDISNPHESARFKKYPKALRNHHLMDTFTGALRLFVDGVVNAFDLERLLDSEIETHHEEALHVPSAVKIAADSLPAFGIVAAVLGIIITMQFLDSPPAVIGGKVAAALVGTMLGILLSYGVAGPIATSMEHVAREQTTILKTVQAGLVSFAGGSPPQVALEFARKTIPGNFRPSAEELEEIIKEAKKS